MEDERWLMMAMLDHLQKAGRQDPSRAVNIHAAIFAIRNAYSLNPHNSATRERYPLDNLSLVDIFKAGRAQLLSKQKVEKSSGADEGFEKFLGRLKEKTTFFEGVEEGSDEYERRIGLARKKYETKRKEKVAGASENGRSEAEKKAMAEKLKLEGNNELKAKNYERAHELYSKCIELDPKNAVYYSNRAAAKLHMSLFRETIEDCKKAIALDAHFFRPRERLAYTYRQLGMVENEMEALKGAIEIAPHNESLQSQLRNAEERMGNGGSGRGVGGESRNGGPGLEGMLGNMDSGSLASMSRAMGLNMPEGAFDAFMNSGASNQIGGMIRNNPEVFQQAIQGMMGMPGMAEAFGGLSNMAGGGRNGDGHDNGGADDGHRHEHGPGCDHGDGDGDGGGGGGGGMG